MFDRAELERLYARIEAPLYNVVYRWVWNRDEAEDIVQETFVRLWAARARVQTETEQAYAYRIALNLAAKRRRTKKLWQWVSLDLVGERAQAGRNEEERLLGAEQDQKVRAAIDALPEDLRRVVTLCELTDLPYEEVASVLGIRVGTVGSRRHAALHKLQAALGSFMEES